MPHRARFNLQAPVAAAFARVGWQSPEHLSSHGTLPAKPSRPRRKGAAGWQRSVPGAESPFLHLLDSVTVPLRTTGSGWVYEDQDPLDAPVYRSPEQSGTPAPPRLQGDEICSRAPAADGIAPCLLRQLIPGQAFPSFWIASRLLSWIFLK